jgi:hypothetical protein
MSVLRMQSVESALVHAFVFTFTFTYDLLVSTLVDLVLLMKVSDSDLNNTIIAPTLNAIANPSASTAQAHHDTNRDRRRSKATKRCQTEHA